MSDIAIRFDGLLFGAVIAVSALLLALGALAAAVRARWGATGGARWRAIARAGLLGCLASLASLAALALYMENTSPPASGPDWLDWAALPWLAIMIAGWSGSVARQPAEPHFGVSIAFTAASVFLTWS